MNADATLGSIEGERIERILAGLERAKLLLDERQYYALTILLTGLVDTAVSSLSSQQFRAGQDTMDRIYGKGDAA
jgi:hypothetical protein